MKPLYSFRSAVIIAGICFSAGAQAQMIGGSVFLKGQYVEAGICANGDFGASTPPAGYHPHGTPTLLGFVADPAMDGWTVGTPAYAGDFFTPGSPFEGWNLQIGSVRAQAQSCAGFTGTGLAGANTAYTASGSKVIGTWVGSFDSMTVKQETTLDTNALFFSMKITLTNNASVPKNDIYYLRSLDPDNDESWPGGGFPTNNTIEYQLPNALNATVVSAAGQTYSSMYLSLGTTDTNAKCLIYSSWPISSTVDLSTIFTGSFTPATYAAGATDNGDVAIGLAFKVAHLAPVDSAADSVGFKSTTGRHPANQASFTYFYAFSPAAVDSAIKELTPDTATTPPPIDHTIIKSVSTPSEIRVYPNPAKEIINITALSVADRISLYDMMGRPVDANWAITREGLNTFSTANMPSGAYVLMVKDASGSLKARIPVRKL